MCFLWRLVLVINQIEVPDGTPFPPPNQRRDYTGYKELRKTPQGRKQLKARGYTVRSKTSVKGKGSAKRRAAKRIKESKFVKTNFIAWDGEGTTDNRGRHHYVLLQNSLGDCVSPVGFTNEIGLSTSVCFDFLLETARQNPGATHVIFSGNYDANKILKDLAQSEFRLRKLWDENHCHWEHYEIKWIPKKWLWIKELDTNSPNAGQTIKLYDVFSFFQMSFVKTLDKWKIEVPEMDLIEEMKAKRGEFDWATQHEIIEDYCGRELEALVLLMEDFRQNHLDAGLPALRGWYGPGAIADGLMNRYGIKKYMINTQGHPVNEAARHAYTAGRIERLLYGNYEGPTKIADINSAYPYSISQLPSLVGGWKLIKTKQPPLRKMSLYHVKMYHHDLYASPLFFRKTNNEMFFPNPREGNYIENWVWTPEYYQLIKWKVPHEVTECWLFQGDVKSRPFGWVEEMYYQRLAWKLDGNPAEKNLKLALNSLYGKTVQQAGYKQRKEIPTYHQIEWGGYITSQTRAQLFNVMASMNFENVVGVETDSIIVAGDNLPTNLNVSDKLGAWGVTDYEGITYIQSGVYWLKKDGEWLDQYSKQRGYVPGTLTRDMIMETWRLNPTGTPELRDENSQAIGLTVIGQGNHFVTLGDCYKPGQTLENWGNWERGPKKLRLWRDTKRAIVRDKDPRTNLLFTEDVRDLSGWSKAYDIEWGKDNESEPY